MTKTKKNNKKTPKSSKQSNPKPKQSTPFSDAGAIVGHRLGQVFNAPYLKGVGRWLGSGIGSIFGSGDYQILGPKPSYNLLLNSGQIPQFSSSKATNIVCHREYIGDISGTANFTNLSYPLNPGMKATFPWLSSLASNYQSYRFHGLVFEFRSLLTDYVTAGSPGVVVMATNYNADDAVYATRQEMENSEFAVATKPTVNLMHAVECKLGQNVLERLYVRDDILPAGQDYRMSDQGNFQFGTQGNPVQTIGELWVSYCVEFFKPTLTTMTVGNANSTYVQRSGTSNVAPLGTTAVVSRGDITATVTASQIGITCTPSLYYEVQVSYNGSTGAVIAYPVVSISNGTFIGLWAGNQSSRFGPGAGATSLTAVHLMNFVANTSNVILTFDSSGSLPTGTTTVDIMITGISTLAEP